MPRSQSGIRKESALGVDVAAYELYIPAKFPGHPISPIGSSDPVLAVRPSDGRSGTPLTPGGWRR
jgi:hypothetical protein